MHHSRFPSDWRREASALLSLSVMRIQRKEHIADDGGGCTSPGIWAVVRLQMQLFSAHREGSTSARSSERGIDERNPAQWTGEEDWTQWFGREAGKAASHQRSQ